MTLAASNPARRLARRPVPPRAASVAAVLIANLLVPGLASTLTIQEARLANGFRILHGESHASGLVASAVLVGAGAARETEGMNGAAHFLEHLLFNGTENRTQEELYRDIDLLGAYANATTRRDHVVYLMVLGGEDLERGLEIQADMLFKSTLPADKFEKERGIIIEEIAKDRSNLMYEAEQELSRLLGRGTAAELPILGTVASIEQMSREDVLGYYRRYYVPSNMTMLVLGDFTTDDLLAAVERYFGQDDTGDPVPPMPAARVAEGIHVRRFPLNQVIMRLRLPGPKLSSREFPALLLMGDLLDGDAGRLRRALRSEPEISVMDVGASVSVEPGRAMFEVRAVVDSTTNYEGVAARLLGAIAALEREGVPEEELRTARTRRRVDEALAAEQIHYLAFTRSDRALHAPVAFVGAAEAALAAVEVEDIRRCAAGLMRTGTDEEVSDGVAAALAVIGPGLAEADDGRDPRELIEGSAGVPAEIEGADRNERAAHSEPSSMVTSTKVTPTRVTSTEVPSTTVAHPPSRIELPNGLSVILASNPDSDVLAMHLAARGRSYCEPEGKSGIADLLHRLLPLGAGNWSREEFGRELDRAGVRLKVTDNPGIPYDNYQTTQEYSFIRLETVDRFYREALALLAAMVFEPAISEETLAEVRREAMILAERDAGRASTRARELMREAFYPESPGARPALGTVEDLESITVDDLRAFHATYFAPSNLVVAVVTGLEPGPVEAAIREHLGHVDAEEGGVADTGSGATGSGASASGPSGSAGAESCASFEEMLPVPTVAAGRREIEVGQDQSWIRVGSVFTCEPDDLPPLQAASLVLSDRIAFELRERQGLAYSVGAALGSRGERAWLVASMGTRPENIERAEAGLVAGVRGLGESEISDEEITKVVKSYLGRQRMRKITRINQARALCLEALGGEEAGDGSGVLESLSEVTAADVRRVAGEYFAAAPLVTAIAR